MTPLQPLIALLAQTERQRDLALADQAKAQAASEAAQTQADQLLAYRREYEVRWRAQFCQEGRIELVRCYQGFVERLTQAVDQQARAALEGRNGGAARVDRWVDEQGASRCRASLPCHTPVSCRSCFTLSASRAG